MACFFGFGSLVNTGTHRYDPVTPASVKGWKRAWANDECYEHAFLSVIPDANSQIQGLMAQVPNNNWIELDAREVGYTRRPLHEHDWIAESSPKLTMQSKPDDVQMYVLEGGELAQAAKPILWSYVETVLFGYYQWFGPEGVQAFIDSTVAWTDIVDDRNTPIYPRYVPAEGRAVDIVIPAIHRLMR